MIKNSFVKMVSLSVVLLAMSQVPLAAQNDSPRLAMESGDIMILLKGGVNLLGGELFDVEKRINIVSASATYEDGTTKDSEMTHSSFDIGLQVDYTLNPVIGFQAGYSAQTINQKISVGGDGYEKRDIAEGMLTSYNYPYAGVMFYAVNTLDSSLYFCGKAGLINGTVQPWVTSYDYFNNSFQAYNVTGIAFGGGLGMNFITSGHYVLGCSFIIMQNQLNASKDLVEYQTLDGSISKSFGFTSYDIDFYVGYKF